LKIPSGKTMPSRPPGFRRERHRSMKRISVLILLLLPFGSSNSEAMGFPLAARTRAWASRYRSPNSST